MTTEHKPENPKELTRIRAAGGKIRLKKNIHRVVWSRPKKNAQNELIVPEEIEDIPFLSIARSLGDHWSWKESSQSYLVSPEPDVSVINIADDDMRCLIIASDGVTNLIDSSEAVKIVANYQGKKNLELHVGPLRPAQLIVNRALALARSLRLAPDNASAIVIIFDEDDDIEEIEDPEDEESSPETPQLTVGAYIRSMEEIPERKRAIETTEEEKENSPEAKKPKIEAPDTPEGREFPQRFSLQPAEIERNTRPRTRSLTRSLTF